MLCFTFILQKKSDKTTLPDFFFVYFLNFLMLWDG